MTDQHPLKTLQPNMWEDGRRAAERGEPREGAWSPEAGRDAIAAFEAGWDEWHAENDAAA